MTKEQQEYKKKFEQAEADCIAIENEIAKLKASGVAVSHNKTYKSLLSKLHAAENRFLSIARDSFQPKYYGGNN